MAEIGSHEEAIRTALSLMTETHIKLFSLGPGPEALDLMMDTMLEVAAILTMAVDPTAGPRVAEAMTLMQRLNDAAATGDLKATNDITVEALAALVRRLESEGRDGHA